MEARPPSAALLCREHHCRCEKKILTRATRSPGLIRRMPWQSTFRPVAAGSSITSCTVSASSTTRAIRSKTGSRRSYARSMV